MTTHRPDVVLITVDALRADRLGAYGYHKGTSPNLDAFAAESLVFERAYAPMPSTAFSITSLMIGRHAYAIAQESSLDAYPTLADRFRGEGYETVALYPPAVYFSATSAFDGMRARHFGFAQAVCEALAEDRDAVDRTEAAIGLLQANHGKPVFLWVHYFAPHEPYVHHPDFGPASPGATESERYDGEVKWVDREIGRLLNYIKLARPHAIVVITADHGEEFGERGGAYHGTSLFDEQIRVPLLVHVPGVPPYREVHPVSTVDLPQMMEQALSAQFGADASSVLPPSTKPVFAELGTTKAVILGQHKAICDFWTGHCRLFDLTNDPGEKHSLAAVQPGKVRHLRGLIVNWLASKPGGTASLAQTPKSHQAIRRARRGDRSANAALISVVADRRLGLDTRIEAAKLLSGASRLVERTKLRRIWPTRQPTIDRWLAGALARVGDSRAAAWLRRMSASEAADDPEFLVRRAVVLADPTDPLATSRIAGALAATDRDEVRCQLITALGRVGDGEAVDILRSAYDDVRMRYCAAEALAGLGDPAIAEFAAAKLHGEPYSNVRAVLVKALARATRSDLRADLEQIQAMEREPIVSAAVTSALLATGKVASQEVAKSVD